MIAITEEVVSIMRTTGLRWLVMALAVVFIVSGVAGTCFAKKQNDVIRIGVLEPTSGTFKYVGDSKVWGVQFVADLWNEKYGGLLGKKIEVYVYDDQMKPDVAVKMATKAILEDGCNVLWQGTGSHIAKALSRVARKYKVIYFMGSVEAESLTGEEADAYHFRVALNTAMHSRAIASYYKDKPEFKKFGIICQDYNFGYEAAEGFKRALKEFRPDAEIAIEVYHPLMTKDFAPYITKLNASGSQAIFTANWGSDLSLLLKQGRGLGLTAQVAAYYLEDLFMLREVQDAAIGHIWADCNSAWYPSKKQNNYNTLWKSRYKKYCGEDADEIWQYPGTGTQQSTYLNMLFTAIQKVGKWDVKKIITTLEGMEYEGFYGTVLMRPEDHQLLMPIPVMQIVKENPLYNNLCPGGTLLRTIPIEETTIPLDKTGCTRKAGEF